MCHALLAGSYDAITQGKLWVSCLRQVLWASRYTWLKSTWAVLWQCPSTSTAPIIPVFGPSPGLKPEALQLPASYPTAPFIFHIYYILNCLQSQLIFVSFLSETASTRAGPVTALCLSPKDNLLLAGYESGLIEIWQHTTMVGYKQVKT